MSAKSESPKAKMTDYFSKTPIRSNSLNRLEKIIRSPDDEDIFEKKHEVIITYLKCCKRYPISLIRSQ